MRLIRTFLLLLPILAGCGGVEVVLKAPVNDKCAGAGLKGCPLLTDGVILYVSGKEDEGKDKLVRGAADNAPADVKKFAKQIKLLKKIPGAGAYTKKLVEVANILAGSAKAKAGATAGGAAGGAAGPDIDDEDDMGPVYR